MLETTSYDNVIKRFIRKIQNDSEFFAYSGKTPEEVLIIVNRRSDELLDEAVVYLQSQMTPLQTVDFLDKDDTKRVFNFKLTAKEENLLANGMNREYYHQTLTELKAKQKYLGSDINVFSPNAERKTFLSLVELIDNQYDDSISTYLMVDRITGEYLVINNTSIEDTYEL